MLLFYGTEAQPAYNFARTFEVKSGFVEYTMSGSLSGQIFFWWDDYGMKYREEVFLEGESSSISLSDGNYFCHLNPQSLTGNRYDAETAIFVQHYFDALHHKELLGTDTVLDFVCDVIERSEIVTCFYKGVPLRWHDVANDITEKAVRFEMNADHDLFMFVPPYAYHIEDATADLRREMMPKYDGDYIHAYDDLLPGTISFEQFFAACKKAIASIGYFPVYAYDQYGIYSVYTENDEGASLHFAMKLNHESYRTDDSRSSGHQLSQSDIKMFYKKDFFYDEEFGTKQNGSVLMVEIPEEHLLLEISAIPEKTEQVLVTIFHAMKLF